MNKDYYHCRKCNGIYLEKEKGRDILITYMRINPLPRVVKQMVKESKLCKKCHKL